MKDNGHGAWSPYLAGGLSGVLLVVSVALTGEFFGASTSFVRLAGMLEEVFLPERVSQMPYFLKTLPKVEWQVMFVLGILLGSFLAAMVSGSLEPRTVPPMWAERFGASRLRRGSVAFVGGVVIMIGARLAGTWVKRSCTVVAQRVYRLAVLFCRWDPHGQTALSTGGLKTCIRLQVA